MMRIYLFENYNNYYNRIIKVNTLESILNMELNYDIIDDVNFNPADGVNTSQIVGGGNSEINVSPDYLIAQDEETENYTRWFVLEATRTRAGQYALTLRRDLVADYFNQIRTAPVFVEKATVDADNKLIFNPEGVSFNQIKKKEILLKDETNKNWLVGYIARDAKHEGEIVASSDKTQNYVDIDSLDIIFNDENEPTKGAYFYNNKKCDVGVTTGISDTKVLSMYASIGGNRLSEVIGSGYTKATGDLSFTLPPYLHIKQDDGGSEYMGKFWERAMTEQYQDGQHIIRTALINYIESENFLPSTYETRDNVNSLNGKLLYSARLNKYYILNIGSREIVKKSFDIKRNDFAIFNPLREAGERTKFFINAYTTATAMIDESAKRIFYLSMENEKVTISLSEADAPNALKTKISANRQHLVDAPYDLFAMEYNIDNLNLANAINLELNAKVYDIQILPYCPVRKMIGLDGIDLALGVEGVDFDYITDSDQKKKGAILWATKCSDRFIIPIELLSKTNNIEKKIANECDLWRIVSPNFNGAFEFSVEKNDGVSFFQVAFTYKPYTPYIQVYPNFKNMYGENFNDARGLICNGDFSIATTSDAWKSYEINNKNYQNIFDTEIKTMDRQFNITQFQNAVGSTLGAATVGLGAGIMTANPALGAAAGIASGFGGLADLALANKSYQIGREAKLDMYNYNLGNIKARPDTLNKVSAYNINNKYFPFIEYYTCSEEEREALRLKLKYDGMTIMAIGKLDDYLDNQAFSYFKGKLIRLLGVGDEYHLVAEINNELDKGVYF